MRLKRSHSSLENGRVGGNLGALGYMNVQPQRIASRSLDARMRGVQCGTAQQSVQGTSRLCFCESCFLVLSL